MALLTKYSFKVSDAGLSRDVFPVNDRLQKEWEKKDGQRYFRAKLKTALRFMGADFLYFEAEYSENDCKSYDVSISRKCGDQIPVLWYTGKMYLNSGKYDHARGIVEYEVEPVDLYSCFIKNIKTKRNILTYGTAKKTLNVVGTVVEYLCVGDTALGVPIDCIPGGATAGLWTLKTHEHFPEDVNGHPLYAETVWVREVWGPTTPPDDSWTLVGGLWVRKVVVYSSVTLNDHSPNYKYEAFLFDFDLQGGISNGRKMQDVLFGLVTAAGCGFGLITSNFLNISPTGASPANAAYDRAATRLANVLVYQRTDVVKWNAVNDATAANITIEDFLNNLLLLFQVYWVIEQTDAGLTFRAEHISYFSETNQNDFTAGAYEKFTRQYRRYTVSGADQIPPFEEFSTPGSRTNSLFEDARITYPAECVTSGQQRSNSVPQVSVDLAGTMYNDLLNPEGLFFMATYINSGNHYVYQDYGQLNGPMSWWELLRYYWKHDRYASTGTITANTNLEAATFLSQKRLKEQPEAKVSVPCAVEAAFDPRKLQRLPLGWSEVQSATYDTKTEVLAIKTTI